MKTDRFWPRWLQFRLRTLLVVLTIVACALGMYVFLEQRSARFERYMYRELTCNRCFLTDVLSIHVREMDDDAGTVAAAWNVGEDRLDR